MGLLEKIKQFAINKTRDAGNGIKNAAVGAWDSADNYQQGVVDRTQDYARMKSWDALRDVNFLDGSGRAAGYKRALTANNYFGEQKQKPSDLIKREENTFWDTEGKRQKSLQEQGIQLEQPPVENNNQDFKPQTGKTSKDRLGFTSKSNAKDVNHYYSKIPNDQAKSLIQKYADKYNIDPRIAIAVAQHETGNKFDDPLIGATNGDGGTGYFQITPYGYDENGNRYVNNQYGADVWEAGNQKDPDAITDAGVHQLADDLRDSKFKDDKDDTRKLRDAYMRFNAGPNYAEKKWLEKMGREENQTEYANRIAILRGRAQEVMNYYDKLGA